jgi:hypothetical protein
MAFERSPEARRALRFCMERISDDYYGAGWHIGLEFMLWKWVLQWRSELAIAPDEEEPKYSRTHEARMLSWLAEQAGGWWCWNSQCEMKKEFVPMAEWLRMYEEKQRRDAPPAPVADRTQERL